MHCRLLCVNVPCTVLNVDYRHTPEWKFPTQFHDTFDAVDWVFQKDRASELGYDTNRVILGGISAGGTMALAAAVREVESVGSLFSHMQRSVDVIHDSRPPAEDQGHNQCVHRSFSVLMEHVAYLSRFTEQKQINRPQCINTINSATFKISTSPRQRRLHLVRAKRIRSNPTHEVPAPSPQLLGRGPRIAIHVNNATARFNSFAISTFRLPCLWRGSSP